MNWYWILGWLPSTFAICGNALVIYLICTRHRLKTSPNYFILSLAVADLGVGACCFPGQVICNFLSSTCLRRVAEDIAVLMIYSSTTNLCIMTFDRHLAIVKPLAYTTFMTKKSALYLIALSWLVPLLTYFVPSLCTSLGGCNIKTEVTVIIWTSMFEFVPCAVLLLFTVKIITTARKHYQQLANLDSQLRFNEPNHKGQEIPKLATARVILTVVAVFLICYSLEVYSSVCYFTKLGQLTDDLGNLVFFLVITNSAAKPSCLCLIET